MHKNWDISQDDRSIELHSVRCTGIDARVQENILGTDQADAELRQAQVTIAIELIQDQEELLSWSKSFCNQ